MKELNQNMVWAESEADLTQRTGFDLNVEGQGEPTRAPRQSWKAWALGESLQAWLLGLEVSSIATRVEICLMKEDYYYYECYL